MQVLPLYQHEGPACQVEQVEPLAFAATCARCSLGAKAAKPCMPADLTGSEGPVLYVLGQGPTQQEDRVGRPFTGANGLYVRGLLQRWPGQVVFDNALRCPTGRDKLKPAMIEACRVYTSDVWRKSGATRVILLGREAMTSFLGEGFDPKSVRRGYTHTSDGTPVFLLIPPSHAARNRLVRGWFEEDLAWAMTATPEPAPRDGVIYQVENESDLAVALEDLEMAPWITYDLETFGAPADNEFAILDAAFTPGGQDVVYSFSREAFERFGGEVCALLAHRPFGGHGVKHDQISLWKRFGFHARAKFDTLWLRRFFESSVELALESAQTSVGMTGGKSAFEFARKGAALLNKEVKGPGKRFKGDPASFTPSAELWFSSADPVQNEADRRVAVERVRSGAEPLTYSFASIPPAKRAGYNCLDTISTDRVYRRYRGLGGDESVRARLVWEKIGASMQHALMVMERNGIAASRAKIYDLIAWMERDIEAIEKQLAEGMEQLKDQFFETNDPRYSLLANKAEWNWNSGSPDTAIFAFDVLRLKCAGLTPSGKRQCTAETLGKLGHPLVDAIIQWRQRHHFKAQYAEGMLAFIRDDGRIHPGIKGVGTETGRPSSEDPNLLNIPRVDKAGGAGKACRDVFVASDDGGADEWVLLETDQSQVELRVAAMLSGDQKMIQTFLDHKDVHLEAAILTAPFLKIDPEEVRKLGKKHDHRSNTKAVVFGALYGEPPPALAKKLNIPRQQAEKLQKLILGHFDRLQAWIREQLALGRKRGFAYTWWDGEWFRRRLLTDIATQEETPARDTAERSSWNTPIQGTACDYTNASLGAIQEWIEREWPEDLGWSKCRLVLTVYDSILLEVRKSVLVRVARKVKEIMESWPTLHGVPLEAELKTGKAFGSLEDYHLPEHCPKKISPCTTCGWVQKRENDNG